MILKTPDRHSFGGFIFTKGQIMKISVIIPAYNCAKYIRQTLDCVRTQNFPQNDIETIIFLDGCTDDTPGQVMRYAADYPEMNLRAIKANENQGMSNARNNAIAIARGQYMHFLDADDIINTEFYKNLYDAAHRTDADVAVASYINERWPDNSIVFSHEMVLACPQDKIDRTCVDRNGYSWRYLIRRDFWNRKKYAFPTDMLYCEDILLMTKMVCHSNHIVLVPGAQYTYKFRPNSMLNTRETQKLQNVYCRRASMETYMFLNENEIQPTCDVIHRIRATLFGLFPLYSWRANSDLSYQTCYLFGILPVIQLRHKIQKKKWKI